MERGIYFDGWFKHNHCYHPSLPLRSRQMLEDLERYHGTVLAWAGLGGGSISLPYLEHEAFGAVDPRMQIYGYMNDSEFIAECNRRGIRLFGIVFEVQGWEYPAVTDEQGHIVRMNLRAEEKEGHGWYGLREFSADACPDAFPTGLKDYYPDGIRDEDGNPVTDLWEECCTRDRFGNPIHAQWVEIKGHQETCYQMCRNNPVWRGYLKKIMEIQVDAGVPGIQLDECELPMTSISSGGCFCKSCMKQFTAFLKERKAAGRLGAEWNGIDLESFHYGEYLKANGCTYPEGAPFYRDYWEFQVLQVRRYFGELANHARRYALESTDGSWKSPETFTICSRRIIPSRTKWISSSRKWSTRCSASRITTATAPGSRRESRSLSRKTRTAVLFPGCWRCWTGAGATIFTAFSCWRLPCTDATCRSPTAAGWATPSRIPSGRPGR